MGPKWVFWTFKEIEVVSFLRKKLKWKYQGCVLKKFGDNIFSWGSYQNSSIPAKFYWLVLFYTLLSTFFSFIRCSFKQNMWKLRNLSDNKSFAYFSSLFLGTFFLATHVFECYHFQYAYDPEYISRKIPVLKLWSKILLAN